MTGEAGQVMDGLWFFSLECHRLIPVAGIRGSLGLPYRWADMAVERNSGEVLYSSRRRPPHLTRPASRVRLELGPPLAAGEHFSPGVNVAIGLPRLAR